jgi:Immunity protein Imm5
MSSKKPAKNRVRRKRHIYLSPDSINRDAFDEKHYDILRMALEESPYLTPESIMSLGISIEWKVKILLSEELFTKNQLFDLALTFAEHVLPVFERYNPDNTTPRRLLNIVNLHREGKTNNEEVRAIAEELDEILLIMKDTVGFGHCASQAAFSILSLTSCSHNEYFESEIEAISEYAQKAANLSMENSQYTKREAEWQLEQIIESLKSK